MNFMDNMDSQPNKPNIAVYGLILLVIVYIGRIQELIPGFDKLSVGKIVVVLSVLLFMLAPRTSGYSLFSSQQVKYILGLLLLAGMSVPLSVWPANSLTFITHEYGKTLFFFFLLIMVVSDFVDVEKIAWAIVCSVLLLSVSVLLADQQGRATASSTYDPNDLAYVIVTFLPIVYYLMKSKTGPAKIILSAVIVVMLIATLATVSRGGLVGLIVVGVAIYLKQGKSLKQAMLPLFIVLIVFRLFAPAAYWDRMSTMVNPQQDYNMQASGGRVMVWKHGLSMMVGNPLLGVGVAGFEVAESRFHGGAGKWSSAHNSFIQIGAELGFIGLILFVKLLASSIKNLRECRVLNESGVIPNWLLDGTEIAFYGYISMGFFLSQAYSPVLYLLVGLTILPKKILSISHEQDAVVI